MRTADDRERARLRALLDRATTQMGVALADAREAHDELTRLVLIGNDRPLKAPERAQYTAVEYAERDAAKRYLVARRWHDDVIARLRDMRNRHDGEASGPAA